ncbi:MAG: hypothetical protein ACYC9O_18070, partial [Candidatus Latescibacterota bacterium]
EKGPESPQTKRKKPRVAKHLRRPALIQRTVVNGIHDAATYRLKRIRLSETISKKEGKARGAEKLQQFSAIQTPGRARVTVYRF